MSETVTCTVDCTELKCAYENGEDEFPDAELTGFFVVESGPSVQLRASYLRRIDISEYGSTPMGLDLAISDVIFKMFGWDDEKPHNGNQFWSDDWFNSGMCAIVGEVTKIEIDLERRVVIKCNGTLMPSIPVMTNGGASMHNHDKYEKLVNELLGSDRAAGLISDFLFLNREEEPEEWDDLEEAEYLLKIREAAGAEAKEQIAFTNQLRDALMYLSFGESFIRE
jgi:hypothetical protein